MCEVVNMETVEGKEIIDGKEFTVKKVTTICKNCGSDKISSEGFKKHTGYTCWNCEVNFDYSNKRSEERMQNRKGKDTEVSIEERNENIDMEKDNIYFKMDEELNDVEMLLLIEQLPITEVECRRLKLFISLGSYTAVAEVERVSEKNIRLSLVSAKGRIEEAGLNKEYIKDIIF